MDSSAQLTWSLAIATCLSASCTDHRKWDVVGASAELQAPLLPIDAPEPSTDVSPESRSPFESACLDYGYALCRKEAECLPAALRLVFGSVDVCARRMKMTCTDVIPARASVWSSPACVSALKRLSCTEFAGPGSVAACTPPLSKGYSGCSFDDQCATGVCFRHYVLLSGMDDCDGYCVAPSDPASPPSCYRYQTMDSRSTILGFAAIKDDCAAGHYCNRKTHVCEQVPEDGIPCNPSYNGPHEEDSCVPAVQCAGGTPRCMPRGDEGAPCIEGHVNECDPQKLLQCVDGHCRAPSFAWASAHCDPDHGGPVCAASGVCDLATHTCIRHAEDGGHSPLPIPDGLDDRDPYWHPGCLPPARLTHDGYCRIRPRICPGKDG